MIPAVQLILAIMGSIFGAKVLGLLGLQGPPANDQSTTGRVYVMPDHPAATTTATTPTAPAPSTSGGSGSNTGTTAGTTAPKDPGVKTLIGKALDNGWVTWGVAAVMFTAPLFISQGRAAFADARDAGREVVDTAQSGYRRVDNADDYTGLKPGRRRK